VQPFAEPWETELSHPDEQSYYEIALTNRQVLVAFVILLGSVFVAFFAGVWVGRGERPTIAEHLEGPPGEEAPGIGPDELEFFAGAAEGRVERRADLQELLESPRADSSLAEDLGVEERPEPPPEPRPDAPPGEEIATPARPSPPGTATEAPPSTPGAADGPAVIQVFSSRDEAQARALLERLRGAGFEAFLSPAEAPGGAVYRVRIGPFAQRAQAERVAERVRREHRLDTWVTSP
jgi:DedD protein